MRPRVPLEERFWSKVDRRDDDQCWLWQASTSLGYGQIGGGGRGGQRLLAHRLAYELIIGPIPNGMQLDHLCRQRRCVNPKHLEPVTREENVRRGWVAYGVPAELNSCPRGHLYDESNTGTTKSGSRYCRECNRARSNGAPAERKRQYSPKRRTLSS